MLVDSARATETRELGPFFVEAAPEKASGDEISGGMQGDPLLVAGTVFSASGGSPIPGATVDVWRSDKDGYYDVQQLEKIGSLAMRGR
jgi:hydroxyquinol 1,2-dioxygenase